jgi:hypothetical protein
MTATIFASSGSTSMEMRDGGAFEVFCANSCYPLYMRKATREPGRQR